MKILITCDDYWHPGEVIERGLRFLEEDGHTLDFVRDARDILTPEMLEEYPLFINAKMNQIGSANQNLWFDPEAAEVLEKDLERYIRNGGGFLALHAGNSFFLDQSEAYCRLLGCAFIRHPPRCRITVSPAARHPITEGIPEFSIRDEHYEVRLLAEDAEIILESRSETGGVQVAGYVRELGGGRICSLMPGHILSVFQNEAYRQVIRQAVCWTARKAHQD